MAVAASSQPRAAMLNIAARNTRPASRRATTPESSDSATVARPISMP